MLYAFLSCYIHLCICLAIWQINACARRGDNKNITTQYGTDAKQLKQMLAVNNWNSESQMKINPVMPSMVFGVISAKFGAFSLCCF